MLTYRGFSAWIVIDEENVQEHLVAIDKENHRVSCWVPSEPGKSFVVYWRDHGGDVDTCSFITLDGFVVPGRFLFGSGTAFRKGVRTGQATERPFVFSKIEETQTSSQSSVKDTGMIILRIKRVERAGGRVANAIQQVPDTIKGNRPPGEVCISFGNEVTTYAQHSTTWSVKSYSKDNISPSSDKPSTYVTFVFRYRTTEFLKAQGIIPDIKNPPRMRQNIRRVSSAPSATGSSVTITPSPTASPRRNLKPSLMQALSHGTPRTRDTRRVASLRGISAQNEKFPGQGFIRFNRQDGIGEEQLQEGTKQDDDKVDKQTEDTSN